jgi:hypothetical protein
MKVVGVPDVVVAESVHVDLELATVHVHVGDEQKRNVRSTIRTTTFEDFEIKVVEKLNFMRDLEVHQYPSPTNYFYLRNK